MITRVGITGGIGSGKSTVAAIFETLGIPVYKADDAAKRLMNEDASLKAGIIKQFGEDAYSNGILNREYVAANVFNNSEKLALLNALVHPATINDGEKWIRQQTTAYAIKEAALIFESGSQQYLDYIIGVYAPPATRMHRSMKRDQLSRESVQHRMDNQMDDEMKMKLCDVVITNDEQHVLIPQVLNIHETILRLKRG